jgi:hypothetical protein
MVKETESKKVNKFQRERAPEATQPVLICSLPRRGLDGKTSRVVAPCRRAITIQSSGSLRRGGVHTVVDENWTEESSVPAPRTVGSSDLLFLS